MLQQLRNVPGRVRDAFKQWDPAGVANEVDVFGLKSLNPLGDDFSPGTAATAAGVYGTGRFLHGSLSASGRGTRPGLLRTGVEKGIDSLAGTKVNAPVVHTIKGLAQARQKAVIDEELRQASRLLPPNRHVQASQLGATQQDQVTKARLMRAARLTKAPPPGTPGPGFWGKVLNTKRLPAVGALLTLLQQEWGNSGYRSGDQAARGIVSGNELLRGQ
jgi:hypothetical protein